MAKSCDSKSKARLIERLSNELFPWKACDFSWFSLQIQKAGMPYFVNKNICIISYRVDVNGLYYSLFITCICMMLCIIILLIFTNFKPKSEIQSLWLGGFSKQMVVLVKNKFSKTIHFIHIFGIFNLMPALWLIGVYRCVKAQKPTGGHWWINQNNTTNPKNPNKY